MGSTPSGPMQCKLSGCSALTGTLVNPRIICINLIDILVIFFSFGCSAMQKTVESGRLYGRPFGGTMILVKKQT